MGFYKINSEEQDESWGESLEEIGFYDDEDEFSSLEDEYLTLRAGAPDAAAFDAAVFEFCSPEASIEELVNAARIVAARPEYRRAAQWPF